jgi:hypothetical protein
VLFHFQSEGILIDPLLHRILNRTAGFPSQPTRTIMKTQDFRSKRIQETMNDVNPSNIFT